MKKCSRCHIEKEPSAFYKNKAQPSGLNNTCAECCRFLRRTDERYRKSYHHGNDRWYKLWSTYKVTKAQYEAMLVAQNERCKICGIHQAELTKCLSVDHDHDTEEIRGLLCSKCNSILGLANDNSEILQSAIEYLSKKYDFVPVGKDEHLTGRP